MHLRYKILVCLGFLVFVGCKKKHRPLESTVESIRPGGAGKNTCFSDYLFHQRLKDELQLLGEEFLNSCFGPGFRPDPEIMTELDKLDKLNHSPTKTGMWDGIESLSGEVDPSNIFRLREKIDPEVWRIWELSTQSEHASTWTREEVPHTYDFLPEIFKGGGKLEGLRVLQSPFDPSGDDKTQSIGNEERYRDWRLTLEVNFSLSCLNQILTMRNKAVILNQVVKNFKNENCCDGGQGGLNASTGDLICKEKTQLRKNTQSYAKHMTDNNTMSFAPSNKGNGEIYYEWPICGTTDHKNPDGSIKKADLTCHKRGMIDNNVHDFGGCSRCELRFPTDKRKAYDHWSNEFEDNPSNYNLRMADLSRITCLTPAAARSAAVSAFSNHCRFRPDDSVCKRHPTSLYTRANNIKSLTPYVHCQKVNMDGKSFAPASLAKGSYKALSGNRAMVSHISRGNFAGAAGANAKVSTEFPLVKGLVASAEFSNQFSKQTNGLIQYEIRGNGNHNLYETRDGRVEFGSGTQGMCSGTFTTSDCYNSEIKGTVGLGLFEIFNASVNTSISEGKCSLTSNTTATDFFDLPNIGGLTLPQLKEICDHAQIASFNNKSTLYKEFGKSFNRIQEFWGNHVGQEVYSVDVSKKNIFCLSKQKIKQGATDEEFWKNGYRVDRLFLKVFGDSENKIAQTIELGTEGTLVSSEDRKGGKIVMSGSAKLPSPTHDVVKTLMEPVVNSSAIVNIIDKWSTNSKLSFIKDSFQISKCKKVNAPIKFKFKPGITCPAQKGKQKFYVEFDEITVHKDIEKDKEVLYLSTNSREIKGTNWLLLQKVSGTKEELGSWMDMYDEGTLSPIDVLSMFKGLIKSKDITTDLTTCVQ